jgi:hypothetical protein
VGVEEDGDDDKRNECDAAQEIGNQKSRPAHCSVLWQRSAVGSHKKQLSFQNRHWANQWRFLRDP